MIDPRSHPCAQAALKSFLPLATASFLVLILLVGMSPKSAAGDVSDMTIGEDGIAFSRLDVIAGEGFVAYARVRNAGNVEGSATARFYRNDGGQLFGVLLGESRVSVASGGYAVASLNVSFPEGAYNLTVSIDDVNPDDSNPGDNVATKPVRVFSSPGLVNFTTPTLLLEASRVTVRSGTERIVPMNVTVLGRRAMGVSLRVLRSSGVFAEPANQLDQVDPGVTVQVYLRISAPELIGGTSPSERELLVQAVGTNAEGNVAVVSLLIHPPASSVSWWNSATVTLTAAGALGVLFAGLHAVEPSRYKLLGLIIPLYTKLRREAVLDQYTRGRINGYITANPGDYFSSIGRALGITGGNLAYHMHILEKEGEIVSAMDGVRKRFFPKGAKTDMMNNSGLPAVQRAICRIVRETPGIRQKDIAAEMGVTSSTVSYHLQKLVAQRIIAAKRKGMSVRYHLVDEKADIGSSERGARTPSRS